jgi:hypothetical protein
MIKRSKKIIDYKYDGDEQIKVIRLNKNGQIVKLHKDDAPMPSEHNTLTISYICYPFFQGEEFKASDLIDKNIQLVHAEEILEDAYHDQGLNFNKYVSKDSLMKFFGSELKKQSFGCVWKWNDDLIVIRFIYSGVVYLVVQNNEIISCIFDKSYTYQGGDEYTRAYVTCNNEFIIENYGDVSSIIKIRFISIKELSSKRFISSIIEI